MEILREVTVMGNTIYITDVWPDIKEIPSKSVQCVVTSPPYYALRDYKLEKTNWPEVRYNLFGFEIIIPEMTCCLGLEPSPEAFIGHLILIFREVKRVLKDDGIIWVNMGDSYASHGKTRTDEQACRKSNLKGSTTGQIACKNQINKITSGLKPKDLIGIPWTLAFALRFDGWYLRQDIIWSKPNPMPESVTDRCTKSHEYIFMLSKSEKYYYDNVAIKTPAKNPEDDVRRLKQQKKDNKSIPDHLKNGLRPKTDKQSGHSRRHAGFNDRWDMMSSEEQSSMGANKRSVWEIATKPFKEAHFATYPADLITDCIKAGSREGDTILDIFDGSGTTSLVSHKLNRKAIGFEKNPEYALINQKRKEKELGIFNDFQFIRL